MTVSYEICNLSHPCKITALERPDYPFLCGEIVGVFRVSLLISLTIMYRLRRLPRSSSFPFLNF